MEQQETQYMLLVKNLPKQLDELLETLQQIQPPAQQIKSFGRRRALFAYRNEDEAKEAMQQLQDMELFDKKLAANIFTRKKPKEGIPRQIKTGKDKAVQTVLPLSHTSAAPQINEYVRKLYACESRLNFEQPPPPYLKYDYPRITPDILDSISIALMSNPRFYTQVLHLMNRMNLEPPFGPCKHKCQAPREMATQTDEPEVLPVAAIVQPVESPVESELETSSDEAGKRARATERVKRKLPSNEEQYKKKARQMLQTIKKQPHMVPTVSGGVKSSNALHEVFEQSIEMKTPKIALHLPADLTVVEAPASSGNFVPSSELEGQQLTLLQRQQLNIYSNYREGEPSNKLYIKNLAKEIGAEDLLQLYERYAAREQLDVKVMQQGRMKGQAFVGFAQSSQSSGATEDLAVVVASALRATNGLVLHQKPMVVSYGKQ